MFRCVNERIDEAVEGRRRSIGALGVVGALIAIALLVVVPASPFGTAHADPPPSCGSEGTPAVVAVHGPHMYIDSDTGLDAQYIGYTVRAGSASRSGLWIQLAGFTGTVVGLSTNESDSQLIADISANQSATQFFLVKATEPTTIAQTHQVRIYQGEPSSGQLVCTRTGSILSVAETIKALANKVRTISATGATGSADIGDAITVTVTGDTGTLGAGPDNDPGVMSITPMAESSFPARAWRLERTEISIKPTGVEASATTFTNRLYLPGSSGPDRPYTAVYTFRAVGSSASRASVKPIQYIASGTQVKHTDIGTIPLGELPVVDPVATLSLTKSASTSLILKSGALLDGARTVTYTVRVTNSGDGVGTLDDITDTLPTGASFVAGSTEFNSTAAGDPKIVGRVLTWSGPIRVPPFDSLTLTYDILLPDLAGTYVNTAEGHYGNTVIDQSPDVDNSSPATASVRIYSTSGTITAGDDASTTTANAQKTITVTTNDSSTYGSVSVQSATDPAHGSTARASGTQVLYTPDAGYSGLDSFDYTISDGASTATATVTVTVTPSAINDTYSAPNTSGQKSFDSVLNNDACTSCTVTTKQLTTTSTPSIANGTLSLASDGTFTWERSSSFTESITFTYTATDGAGSTATATVTIYVGKAVPDKSLVPYNTMTVIDVLANDLVGGNPNVSSASDPPHGSNVVNNKKVEYTPDPNYWGTDSFTYTVSGAGTAVNVLVEPPDSSTQTDLLTTISSTIAGANCSSCTYSVVTPPSTGVFTLSSDGSYTYVPASNGTYTATWRVTDPATLLTSDAVLTIKVGPRAVNDTYPEPPDVLFSNEVLSGNLTSNDTCAATCTTTKLTNPAFGTATVNSDGTFTFNPSGEIGTTSFTYRIASTSSPGITSDGTATISVDGADDDEATTNMGASVDVDVEVNDPCSGCTVSAVATPSVGTASINVNESVRYTPPSGFTGRVQFDYTVTKNSRSTTATITVYVRPSAVDDSAITIAGQPVSINVLTNDICARCTVNPTLGDLGGRGSASVSGNVVTYSPGGWTSSSLTDLATFTYTITNSYAKTSTATVSVYVGSAPDAVDDEREVRAGSVLTFDPRTGDPRTGAGADSCLSCTVEKDFEPPRAAASVLATNWIRFTPAPLTSGRETMRYLLIDPVTGLFDSATITVDILPLAVNDSARTGVNSQVSTNVAANDSCTSCTVEVLDITGDANAEKPSPSGNLIVYQPSTGFTGTATIYYQITDSSIGKASDAVLTVVVDDALPDAKSTPYQTLVDIDDLLANDFCDNCDLKSLNPDERELKGSIALKQSDGKDRGVRFQPASNMWGIEWFGYRAGPSSSSLQALKRSTYSNARPFAAGGFTVQSTVTILIGPPAITVNATGGVPINGNLILGTPSNDPAIPASDCGTRCTFTLVSAPDDGEVTLNSDGSYQYTAPLAGVSGGSDTFTYRVTDTTTGVSQIGTVTFLVVPGTATMSVVKTAGSVATNVVAPNDRVDAGDRIPYTITVTNTGNVSLREISVTDSKIPTLTCDDDNDAATSFSLATYSLLPSGTIICTGTYTITQAEVNSGLVNNTADATAKVAGTTVPASDSETTSLTRSNQVDISKSTTATSLTAGDHIAYTITVTNTGNTTLSGISIVDSKIPTLTCDDDNDAATSFSLAAYSLLPSGTIICTGPYTVKESDVAATELKNEATVEATGGGTSVTKSASVTINSSGVVSASLTKSAGAIDMTNAGSATRVDAGDSIPYTITLTNTGTASLASISITDVKLGTLSCSGLAGPVAPGSSVSCSGTYVITQADINSGSVANTASFTASPPTGSSISGNGSTTVGLTQFKSLALVKTANATELPASGQPVTYTLTATNSGNTTLDGVEITDDLVACSAPVTGVTLAPGDSASCTATYTVLVGDVAQGYVTNIASASGTTTVAPTTTVTTTATKTLYVPAAPAIDLDKSVSSIDKDDMGSESVIDVGDKVIYSFVITNAGNRNLSGFELSDPEVGLISCETALSDLTLAPGGFVVCSGTHPIEQVDLNAGVVENVATVSASYGDQTVEDSDGATAEISRVTNVTITKSADRESLPDAGTDVTYSIVVTNNSNVPLSLISISDPMFEASGGPRLTCDDDDDNTTAFTLSTKVLAIGGAITCRGTYTVTNDDRITGTLTNEATVTASIHGASTGYGATLTDSDAISLGVTGTANATIEKTAILHNEVEGLSETTDIGDRIDYTIMVTNEGSMSLDDIEVDDDLVDLACDDDLSGLVLHEGESVTCTGSLTLLASHLEAGSVSNVASLSADADGTSVTRSDEAVTDLDISSGIEVTKVAAEGTLPEVGSSIHYTITVENVGDQSIDGMVIEDTKVAALSCDSDDDPETPFTLATEVLAVNDVVTCTGTYVVTNEDVDAGFVSNQVDVEARTVTSDLPLSESDFWTVDEAAMPSINLIKTAGRPDITQSSPNDQLNDGDTITYSFVISNTGNRPLEDIVLDDPLVDDFTCVDSEEVPIDLTEIDLLEGDSIVCWADYEITQTDIDRGSVTNEAEVSGVFGENTVSDESSTTTPLTRSAAIAVHKTAEPGSIPDPLPDDGLTIQYTIVVENIGLVTLTDLVLVDTLESAYDTFECVDVDDPSDFSDVELAPGDEIECTGTYNVSSTDPITNEVEVTASGPEGEEVSASTTNVVTVDGSTALDIRKTATIDMSKEGDDDRVEAGDEIVYEITATNTGDLAIDSIEIIDVWVSTFDDFNCDNYLGDGTLDPDFELDGGESTSCSGTYVITQNDLQIGTLENTASVTGKVGSAEIFARTSVVTGLEQVVDVTSEKSADADTLPAAGETVEYTIVVVNDGNVVMTELEIVDDRIAMLTCTLADEPISPGIAFGVDDEVVCHGLYTVTDDDVAAGALTNTVEVSGAIADPIDPVDPVVTARSGRRDLSSTFSTLTYSGEAGPSGGGSPSRSPRPTTVEPGTITGLVWFDLDNDGTKDDDEPALPGVVVGLDGTPNAPSEVRGFRLRSSGAIGVVTSTSGAYTFTNVATGAHTIIADMTKDVGILKSWDTDGGSDWKVSVDVPEDGEAVADVAGIGTKTVEGIAYDGTTGSTIAQPIVTITWAGFDDTFDTDDDVAFTTSGDASGYFMRTGLPIGKFTCQSSDPATGLVNDETSFELSADSADSTFVACPSVLPKTGLAVDRTILVGLYLLGLGLAATTSSTLIRRNRRRSTDVLD